jgi:periplasmic mercuric ion binding protein
MKNFLKFLGIILVVSCANETKKVESDLVVKTVEIADGKNETVANIEIEGMTCEMGCGNSIKSAIGKLEGVYTTEIKFTEEQNKDFAVVKFNPSVLNEKNIADAITSLFNGQYKIHEITLEKHVAEKLSDKKSNQPVPNIFSIPEVSSYHLPNIFNIFFF